MTKVNIKRLDSVTKNDTTATERINDNFSALQAAIENTVSRDGSVPNYMDADLDLNSYRIINAGDPVNDHDVVTIKYFEEQAGGAIEAAAEAKANAAKAASSAQSALVASNNAIGQVAKAESLLLSAQTQLTDTQEYVSTAKADINNTVATGKQEISTTSSIAVSAIETTVNNARTEINSTIKEAQTSLSDTIAQAVEDVKAEATKAAEGAIQNAADEATQVALNQTVTYVENTAIPAISAVKDSAISELENVLATDKSTLEGYVSSVTNHASIATSKANEAKASASAAKTSETNAKTSETNAKTSETNAKSYADRLNPETFVKTSGDQSIGGTKTFTSTITRSHAFSGATTQTITDNDSNGKGRIAIIPYYTGNTIYNRVYASNTTAGKDAYLDVTIKDDGSASLHFAGSANTKSVNFPTPAATSNNTEVPTTAWVNTYVNSNAVKTSGNQTIAGTKTFTSMQKIQGQQRPQEFKASNIDLTTPPSANQSMLVDYVDKNGKRIGVVGAGHYPSGRYRMYLQAANIGSMGIGVDTNGKVYTEAPTPPASDNSTQIATTAWVNNKHKVVTSLPTELEEDTFYYIPEA